MIGMTDEKESNERRLRTPEPPQKREKERGRQDPPGNEAACRCLLTERENFLRQEGDEKEHKARQRKKAVWRTRRGQGKTPLPGAILGEDQPGALQQEESTGDEME